MKKINKVEVEKVAQEIIITAGKDVAEGLVEYANLAKRLAADLTDKQLEDSRYIESLLQEQLTAWNQDDWYQLTVAVRQKKRSQEHEKQTAEAIYNEMPYFAQRAAEVAVRNIIQAVKTRDLYHAEKASSQQVDILWTMFYCMGIDIKKAAEKTKEITENKILIGENALLLAFLKELRVVEWEHGEVTKLRTKELSQ